MALIKDIWRVGVARAPITTILDLSLDGCDVVWLPPEGHMRFIADPFALRRDDGLHVLVESYDYRDRKGRIDAITLDDDLQVTARRTVLDEPWHLSYPFLLEADGEVWMLPEAFRSGRLTLYRAERFPDVWTPGAMIELDHPPIDATPLFHDGLWWLFYTPATTRDAKMGHLHVAFAERLAGPWRPHPGNPVRTTLESARPGGTPVVRDGRVILPVQDCSATYGGAVRPLVIETLSPDRFEAHAGDALRAPPAFAPFTEGFHTLAAAGDLTLIDAKRTAFSARMALGDLRRKLKL